jgi:serine/threonine-protein phosphatase PP1 catalytic subunit
MSLKNKNNDDKQVIPNYNFIDFINHLLTFNKQQELFQKRKNQLSDINLNILSEILPFRFNISAKVVIKLCDMVIKLFQAEANLLNLEHPLFIFGDIHGQFADLIHFLEMTGLPPDNKFLFMGDYVDRGNNSIEVCMLLFAMKIMFPKNIYLLRGNHECPEINRLYGLYSECESRFGNDKDIVFNKLNDVLCALPLCAIINHRIFCVHGGISPHLTTLDEINQINRFCTIPDSGILCDLMWSDPTSSSISDWGINSRGISCTYGITAVARFLKVNRLQLICRAHQLVSEGYKFFADNKLVTVFSAPNYCGNCGNDGAVMKIADNLVCSFIIIKPTNDFSSSSSFEEGKQNDKNKNRTRKSRVLDKIDY